MCQGVELPAGRDAAARGEALELLSSSLLRLRRVALLHAPWVFPPLHIGLVAAFLRRDPPLQELRYSATLFIDGTRPKDDVVASLEFILRHSAARLKELDIGLEPEELDGAGDDAISLQLRLALALRLLRTHAASLRRVRVGAVGSVPGAQESLDIFNDILRASVDCPNLELLSIDLDHQWTLVIDDDVHAHITDALVLLRCPRLTSLSLNSTIGHSFNEYSGWRYALASLPPSVVELRLIEAHHFIDFGDDTLTNEPDLCVEAVCALRGNTTLRTLTLSDYADTLRDERTLVDGECGVLATTQLRRLVFHSRDSNDEAAVATVVAHLPPSLEELVITEEMTLFDEVWVANLQELLPALRRCPNLRHFELSHDDSLQGDFETFNCDTLRLFLRLKARLLSPSDMPPRLSSLLLSLKNWSSEIVFDANVLLEPATELARQLGANAALKVFRTGPLPIQSLHAFAVALCRNSALEEVSLVFVYDAAREVAHAVDALAAFTAAMSGSQHNSTLRRPRRVAIIRITPTGSDDHLPLDPAARVVDAVRDAQHALAAHPT